MIADDARSQLRAKTGLPARARRYPWDALWAVLPDPERDYGSTLWQWFRGAQQMLGVMPTGLSPHTGESVVSLFRSFNEARYHDVVMPRYHTARRGGVLAASSPTI